MDYFYKHNCLTFHSKIENSKDLSRKLNKSNQVRIEEIENV